MTHFLDVGAIVTCGLNNHYDLYNKSQGHWNEDIPEHWTEMLNYWYTRQNKLIVENSVINSGIIHYSDENFLTDDIIDTIRTAVETSDRRKTAA